MKANPCCGPEKLCSLSCPCHLDIKVLMPLVNKPRYICRQCGRAANRKQNLCRPVPLR